MKLKLSFLGALSLMVLTLGATVHNVTVSSNQFSPSSLTIAQGDTVVWTNTGGTHNVNGTQTTFSGNPASFGNTVGAGWTYTHVFTVNGSYNYQCDPHSSSGMTGTITVNPAAEDLLITAVYDGPLLGGTPKGVELFAINAISDLSVYGLGSANNGGGSDSVEFQFPAVSVAQGTYIYVTTDSTQFYNWFGFSADYIDGPSAGINGDDAVELFSNGIPIDVFGDINVDGTGTAWEYMDSWAYRKDATGPDSTTFVLSNWNFGGPNALDGETANSTATTPVPVGTYSLTLPMVATVNFASAAQVVSESAGTVTVNLLISPTASTAETIDLQFVLGSGVNVPADGSISPVPNLTTGILQLNVPANEDSVSFDITLVDDMVVEGNETLFVSIDVLSSGLLAGSTDSMIFVVEDNDYQVATIGDITTVDANGVADSLGITFETYGVVYTDDFDGNAGLSFYIYDNTGGVNIFNFSDVSNYNVTRGDSIMVIGEIDQFAGLTEIFVDSINVLKSGVSLIDPQSVSVLDESTEGEFIELEGWWFVDTAQWDGSGSSFNIDITNGTDTFVMRVDSDIDLATMPLPTAGLFTVRGAGAQFTFNNPALDGYQIFPRDAADIITIDEVSIDSATAVDANGVPTMLGTKLIVSGVVYTDDFDGNNGHSFYIYDNTGGVNIFNFNDVSNYTVTRGDSIRVIGEVDQFRGLTEIFADSIEVLKTGVALKFPTVVTDLDESTEGEFVELQNWTMVDTNQWTTGSGSGGFNVDITNGTDTVVMRIDADIDLYNMPLPTSGAFVVRGAGSQFTFSNPPLDGYQIFPRDSSDIMTNIGLAENPLNSMLIYPNPASETVYLHTGANELKEVSISAVNGQVVRRMSSSNPTVEVKLNGLRSGVYMLRVDMDKHSITRKLIVK